MDRETMTDERRAKLVEVKRTLDAARADAEAVLASTGLLALMVSDLVAMAKDGASLALTPAGNDTGEVGKRPELGSKGWVAGFGDRLLDDAAQTLRTCRERVAAVLNDLGDFFNDRDACSEAQADVSVSVYALLRKRATACATEPGAEA